MLFRSLVMEMMVAGRESVAGAVVEGLDWGRAAGVTQISRRFVAGVAPAEKPLSVPGAGAPEAAASSAAQMEVALGEALASRIGARVGDVIRLVIPFSEGDLDSASSSKVVPARVTGLVKMGMFEYDSKFVFAPIEALRSVVGAPNQATSMKIRLVDGSRSREASDRGRTPTTFIWPG